MKVAYVGSIGPSMQEVLKRELEIASSHANEVNQHLDSLKYSPIHDPEDRGELSHVLIDTEKSFALARSCHFMDLPVEVDNVIESIPKIIDIVESTSQHARVELKIKPI